jgi:hypothetical protein
MDGTVAAEGETGWALEDLEGFSELKRSCERMNEAAFSYRSGSIGKAPSGCKERGGGALDGGGPVDGDPGRVGHKELFHS